MPRNAIVGSYGGSEDKASACNAGDPGSIPGLGRSPGEGNGTPLQYPCLENPMEGGAWWATVHGVAKSRTRLSDFTYFLLTSSLDFPGGSDGRASAYNSRDPGSIPGLGRSSGGGNGNPLQYSWKSHGWRSVVGYCPWGRKESDTTEWLHFTSW